MIHDRHERFYFSCSSKYVNTIYAFIWYPSRLSHTGAAGLLFTAQSIKARLNITYAAFQVNPLQIDPLGGWCVLVQSNHLKNL